MTRKAAPGWADEESALVAHLRAEIARLQRIIDSRPAINAALPESYIKWSQEIYLTDFLQVAGRHS